MRHPQPVTKRNTLFQQVETLKRNREKRSRSGEFVVEGVTPLNLALRHGWEARALLFSRERPLSEWARGVIESWKPDELYELSEELMAELSDKEETSEILAVVKMRPRSADEIPLREEGLILVFDRPHSPGNFGSSLRSAEALGVDAIVVTGHAVDLHDPAVIRASIGTAFTIPVVSLHSHTELVAWRAAARERGVEYRLVGTSARAAATIFDTSLTGPLILVMGNETVGMSKGYREACDEIARLPLSGSVSSLNLSAAASIFLYEVQRQRVSVNLSQRLSVPVAQGNE